MIGGMISSTLLTLIVIPAIYALVKGARLRIFHPAINPDGKPSEAGAG
jgi:copper/silver efflux system protein